jgi:hypothetical protein
MKATFYWKFICTENIICFSHLNFEKERQSAFPKKDQIQLNAKVENLKEVIVRIKEKSKKNCWN